MASHFHWQVVMLLSLYAVTKLLFTMVHDNMHDLCDLEALKNVAHNIPVIPEEFITHIKHDAHFWHSNPAQLRTHWERLQFHINFFYYIIVQGCLRGLWILSMKKPKMNTRRSSRKYYVPNGNISFKIHSGKWNTSHTEMVNILRQCDCSADPTGHAVWGVGQWLPDC